MKSFLSFTYLEYLYNRFNERLWVRPLIACLFSISAVFLAKGAEILLSDISLPTITYDSLEKLLSVLSASMLVIATFSVSSMVTAYASAASTATPRAFSLVIADDQSQNALSIFIGTFIFSIVALVALMNNYFLQEGLFVLFIVTLSVFTLVITTFVKWVDSIARLGRMSSTINKVEDATSKAMTKLKAAPTLQGLTRSAVPVVGKEIYAASVGYIQYIDLASIQQWAEKNEARVTIVSLPGKYITACEPLAYITSAHGELNQLADKTIVDAFQIGRERLFDFDPRFGLVVLSEIACRALSPAVNDPGTAINIISVLTRLFTDWAKPLENKDICPIVYNRIEVPELKLADMFDDAFTSIARDGAGSVEVATMLQQSLKALTKNNHAEMEKAAITHSRLILKRSSEVMYLQEDVQRVKNLTL